MCQHPQAVGVCQVGYDLRRELLKGFCYRCGCGVQDELSADERILILLLKPLQNVCDVPLLYDLARVRVFAHPFGDDFGGGSQQDEHRIRGFFHNCFLYSPRKHRALGILSLPAVTVIQRSINRFFNVETDQVVVGIAVKSGLEVVINHVPLELFLEART